MILSFLFGCTHKRFSWPQHSVKRMGSAVIWRSRQAHVCCLDCGAEAIYDLEAMRPLWKRERAVRFQEKQTLTSDSPCPFCQGSGKVHCGHTIYLNECPPTCPGKKPCPLCNGTGQAAKSQTDRNA